MPKSNSPLQNYSELRFCTMDNETAQFIGTAEVDSTGVRAVDMLSNTTTHTDSFMSGDTSKHGADGVANVCRHGNYHDGPEYLKRNGNMRRSQCFNLESIASVGLFQMARLGTEANNSTHSLSMDSGHSKTVLSHMNDHRQIGVSKSMVTTTQSDCLQKVNETFLTGGESTYATFRSTPNALIEDTTSVNERAVSAHSNASVWQQALERTFNPAVPVADGFPTFQENAHGFLGLTQTAGGLSRRTENTDGLPSFLQNSGESSIQTQDANGLSIGAKSVSGCAESKNNLRKSALTSSRFSSNSPYMLPPQETGIEENVTGTNGEDSGLEGLKSVGLANSNFSEGLHSFHGAYKKACSCSETSLPSPAAHKMAACPPRFLMKDNVSEMFLNQLHNRSTETAKNIQIRTSIITPVNQSAGQVILVDGGNGSAQISDLSAGQASKSVIGHKPVTVKVKCKQNKSENPSINPRTPKKAQAEPAAGLNAQTTSQWPVQMVNLMSQSTQTASPPIPSALNVPHLQWPATGTLMQRIPNHLLIANRAFHSPLVQQIPPMQASGTFHQPLAQAVSPQPSSVRIPNTLSITRGNFLHPFLAQQVPISAVQGEGTLEQPLARTVSSQASSLGIHNPLLAARGTPQQSLAQHVPTPAAQGKGTLQQPLERTVFIQPVFSQKICNPSSSVMGTHHPSLAHGVPSSQVQAKGTFQQTLTQTAPPQQLLVKKTPAHRPYHLAPTRPLARTAPIQHIKWQGPKEAPKLRGENCFLCKRDLSCTPEGSFSVPADPPPTAVLSCGHRFHDSCLQKITSEDEASNPPCICCALGES